MSEWSSSFDTVELSGKNDLTDRARGRGDQPGAREPDLALCSCLAPPKGRVRRSLVVCIDGTANQFSEKNSNVVELYSRLVKSDEQLTYYNSGIGTYVHDSKSWFSLDAWRQWASHNLDMAIATTFKQKVLSAYQWLSENYQTGDKIFLFGFSCGAYQVRVIAGMIEKVGLLHKGNNEQIPFAYELYTNTTASDSRQDSGARQDPNNLGKAHSLCQGFKKNLSRDNVRVHFVGAWETVSSVGFFKGTSLPETTNGMIHVCVFRHALALDEHRVKFLPEYVNGGEGPAYSETRSPDSAKEVWFAGTHSDIGGGNALNKDLNSFGPSLRWMTYEAIRYGLKMNPISGQWSRLLLTQSMDWMWFLEKLPIPRLSYRDGEPDSVIWSPHNTSPRQMKKGQMIHDSVFEEMRNGYEPHVQLYGGITWDKDKTKMQSLIEEDPYTDATGFLTKISKDAAGVLGEETIDAFYGFIKTENGPRSITESPDAANILTTALNAKLTFLEQHTSDAAAPKPESHHKTLNVLATALEFFKPLPSTYRSKLIKDLSVLEQRYPEHQETWGILNTLFVPTRFASLFALIIGINKYRAGHLASLVGCIPDADDVRTLLTKDLGVRTNRVVSLYDEAATAANIVQEFRNLAQNDAILQNDPILIYYAGHSTKNFPIVPHDHGSSLAAQTENTMTASELTDLLKQLATAKGGNITVILEGPPFNGEANDFAFSTDSHVLLAACSKNEMSREANGRGVFTKALTTLLREIGPRIHTITYHDIVRLLHIDSCLMSESPNCGGKYDTGLLFDPKTPGPERRLMFQISNQGQRFVLEAGNAHGIIEGAKFEIYDTDDENAKPVGYMTARDIQAFSTRLDFDPSASESTIYPTSTELYGLQIHLGNDADIRFAIADKDYSIAVEKEGRSDSEQARRSTVKIVEDKVDSEAIASTVRSGLVALDITDKICNDMGLQRLPYLIPGNTGSVWAALRHAADYFWDLRRSSPRSLLADKIILDARLLEESASDSRVVPTGPNPTIDSAITIYVMDANELKSSLGLTLKNTTRTTLYVWLFAFNMLDLSIDIVYKPVFTKGSRNGDPCLPAEGELRVGYTLSTGTHLLQKMKVGVTYLKAFVTSTYVDLSYIATSSSPFDKRLEEDLATQAKPLLAIPTSSNVQSNESRPLRLRGGRAKAERPIQREIWATLTVPVVIKRIYL